MSDQPAFAIDMKWTEIMTGVEFMLHIRADTYDEFTARLRQGERLTPAGQVAPAAAPAAAPPRLDPAHKADGQRYKRRLAGGFPSEHRRGGVQPTPATGPVCPEHDDKPMKKSNFNGHYCTAKLSDGTYCQEVAP